MPPSQGEKVRDEILIRLYLRETTLILNKHFCNVISIISHSNEVVFVQACQIVRKDIDVNGQERIFNMTLRHKFK